jgi:cytochrome c oxidase subunit 1
VLFGGSIFGLFAGLYYWWPKISGRLLGEGLGRLQFALMFIGFNLTFGPQHFLGVDGMPRRIFTYPENMGWDLWNFVSTIGAYTLGIAILVFIINVIERAGNDPWDGRTLEWAISSPPAHYNFVEIPTVDSRDSFWMKKHPHQGTQELASNSSDVSLAAQTVGEVPIPEYGEHGADPGEGHHGAIHMPDPSYWPLIAALGIFVTGSGILFSLTLIPIGLFIVIAAVYGWALEPVNG